MIKDKERFEQIGSKIDPAMAEVLDACCEALQVDVYHLLQWFCYVIVRASAPLHELDPRIQKLMALMESDAGWQKSFNLCNPDELKVSKLIMILEQKGHKGFGAVMIDRPWMDKEPQKVDDYDPGSPEPQMTENVDDILERILEVTMPGIYKRLRRMGARMQTDHFSDVLLTMLDAQDLLICEQEDREEGPIAGDYYINGKRVEYGKRTKRKKSYSPDTMPEQVRIVFDEYDREISELEAKNWEGEYRQTDFQPPKESEVQDD